jgi:hypothetical protein
VGHEIQKDLHEGVAWIFRMPVSIVSTEPLAGRAAHDQIDVSWLGQAILTRHNSLIERPNVVNHHVGGRM